MREVAAALPSSLRLFQQPPPKIKTAGSCIGQISLFLSLGSPRRTMRMLPLTSHAGTSARLHSAPADGSGAAAGVGYRSKHLQCAGPDPRPVGTRSAAERSPRARRAQRKDGTGRGDATVRGRALSAGGPCSAQPRNSSNREFLLSSPGAQSGGAVFLLRKKAAAPSRSTPSSPPSFLTSPRPPSPPPPPRPSPSRHGGGAVPLRPPPPRQPPAPLPFPHGSSAAAPCSGVRLLERRPQNKEMRTRPQPRMSELRVLHGSARSVEMKAARGNSLGVHLTVLHNHRIIEYSELEGNLKDHQV